ncbi:hypothetical protein GUITHDRAFT_101023 [Guillardia theta CCMP2712]|uniref:Uncharacterized protein n=1 Tax=Guillardia theta (strain CCMP2712) TaxID=905079 RepID=L1JYP9_GUITC|nr:hypothetical protein GUITHDRAFT_101023 [Guillardia theta CCMP2712]EKX53320.1 hypothetical protein GUITHDRAFT_101023 [Guillardia theta CCMP2712]|eukprot:XP_005840300.1 hypothetical protein GUITHDRAFT_101023 [Guillardia theta CCMP2712]
MLDVTEEVDQSSRALPPRASLALLSGRRLGRSEIKELEAVIKREADKLGHAHPFVEEARLHLNKLRTSERETAWEELKQMHNDNVDSAIKVRDEDELERAIHAAMFSPLGKRHPIVIKGKRAFEEMVKERNRAEYEEVERVQVEMLIAAKDDMEELKKAIAQASDVLGSSHPAVEAARLDLKDLRDAANAQEYQVGERKRRGCRNLCDYHERNIQDAASKFDEEGLAWAISRADKAGLGPAHPIIERGKQQLSQMQRDRTKRERRAREVESLRLLLLAMKIDLFGGNANSQRPQDTSRSSESSLSSSLAASIVLDEPAMLEYEDSVKRWDANVWLAEAGSWEAAEHEIAELQKTLKKSKIDLGELHFVVLAAYNRIREMRDALHRAQYKEIGDPYPRSLVPLTTFSCPEQYHISKIAAAAASGDLEELDKSVRLAAASEMSWQHPAVQQGKRLYEEGRKIRVRILREEQENHSQLELAAAMEKATVTFSASSPWAHP